MSLFVGSACTDEVVNFDLDELPVKKVLKVRNFVILEPIMIIFSSRVT